MLNPKSLDRKSKTSSKETDESLDAGTEDDGKTRPCPTLSMESIPVSFSRP